MYFFKTNDAVRWGAFSAWRGQLERRQLIQACRLRLLMLAQACIFPNIGKQILKKFCTSKNGCEIRFLKNKIAENSITRKIPKDHQPVHVFDPNTFTFLGDQGPWDGTKTLSLTPSILPDRQRQLGAIPVATLRVQLQEDGRLSDTAHEFVDCFLGWARSSVTGRIPADYVQLGEDFLV